MYGIIFPILLVLIFVLAILTAITTHKVRGMILFALDAGIAIAYLILYFQYIGLPGHDSTWNYGLLFAAPIYLAQSFALLIQKRWAGPLVVRLQQPSPTAIMGSVAVLLFLFMIFFALGPSLRSEATGLPVFDDDYYKSRLVMLLFLVPITVYYFLLARQRTEFHQRGILREGRLWAWSDFESYTWNESSAASEVEVTLQPKRTTWWTRPMKFSIPPQGRQSLDELLTKTF